MSNTTASPEVTYEHHHSDAEFYRRVKRTTILLSVITAIELGIGLLIYTMHKSEADRDFIILLFKGVVCILTLAKAYYIVSVFMHLGDEIRMERMTPEVISQVAQLARGAVNSDTTAVAYFEVGTRAFRGLAPSFVDSVFRDFGPRAVRKDALPFPAFTPSSEP